MLCNNMQMIGSRRRFENYANFSLFYPFLRRRRQPDSRNASKREVVLCLKNYMKRAFRGKYIGGGGQIGAEGKKVSLL